MSTAIDKTLTRVHDRVKNQEFYEAHQAVRTIVARYLRSKDYAHAVGLLYNSALLLAKSRQTGSASDLLLYMIKIYEDAKVSPSGPSKGRIAEISWHLDCHDAVIKQVAQKALGWAPNDVDLAQLFGTLFVRNGDIYEAEKYLLLGGKDSAQLLAEAHAEWANSASPADPNVHSLFMSRGVLGYLSLQNIRNAREYLTTFESRSTTGGNIAEFVRLLVTTCQTKDAQLYKQLKTHYRPTSLVPAWEPALQTIERDFFNIVSAQPFNLMDMMGGFMK